MSDPKAKSPERESLEALLRIPLPDGMVEDAAGLARTTTAVARAVAAGLPLAARDPTDFLAVLESLGPETQDGAKDGGRG
jgi:hypothetical protein